MQEHPRHSLNEIRLLLAQYLDGALGPDQLVEVELLLSTNPHYQAELFKLQETRGLLQQFNLADDLKFSKVSDATWKEMASNIARQLEADQKTEPETYDFEFVSAYYDGELNPQDPAYRAFEAQLLQNDAANRMLADVGALSEMLRQFGYRQEEACAIDLTRAVMQAYQTENIETGDLPASTELSAQIELVSAFADGELSAKETIAVNRLLEQEPIHRQHLAFFHRLSDSIHSTTERLIAQAPDHFWDELKVRLQEDIQQGKVVPIRTHQARSAAKKLLRRAAIPAAAVVLALFSIPGLRDNNSDFMISADQNKPQYEQMQLASAPLNAPGFMRVSNGPRIELNAAQDMSSVQSLSPPEEPFAPSSRKLASHERKAGLSTGLESPSSEAYLFRALDEQMPDGDVSSLLGK